MKEKVSLIQYLSDDRGMSSMVLNELIIRDEKTGEERETPCIIFKEFSKN